MLRLIVITALLGLGACASSSEEVRDGARAACEAEHTPAGEMEACLERMEASIQAARAYRAPSAPARQP
jgi:hypothetical protein